METFTVSKITEEELRAILLQLGVDPTRFAVDVYGEILRVASGYDIDSANGDEYTIEELVDDIWFDKSTGSLHAYQVAGLLAEAAYRGFCPKTDYFVS